MRALSFASLVVALAACAGPRATGTADPGDRLFRSKCAACHRPYPPEERSRAEWARVLERMAPRAHLTAAERASLLGWLQAHARDAGPAPAPPAGQGPRVMAPPPPGEGGR